MALQILQIPMEFYVDLTAIPLILTSLSSSGDADDDTPAAAAVA